MIDLTSQEALGNALWVMIAGYVVVIAYSVYMLYLGKKQADVSKKIDDTNKLLLRNNVLSKNNLEINTLILDVLRKK